MLHILTGLFRQFGTWERSAQFGFGLAVVLMIPALIVARTGPDALRWPATIGLMGIITTAQLIFMWANRGMITPYARAQRLYLREDFSSAIDILAELRDQGKADFRALTLLGNAYRQLGRLSESATILFEAVNIRPDHYFPHYGFGRTLLTEGRYADAIQHFDEALRLDAPNAVLFDLGEAMYRIGDPAAVDVVRNALAAADLEAHRALMAAYILYVNDAGPLPDKMLLQHGLPFWENVATLYSETPYGVAVAGDIEAITTL